MGFFLFILVNAALFIRPTELFPWFEVPIYNYLILACLAVSVPHILGRNTKQTRSSSPISLCVLGVLALCVLSLLVRFRFGRAVSCGLEFAKVLVYYFLLVSLVDSFHRLRLFLLSIAGFTIVITVLAALHYHEIIVPPSLEAVQQPIIDPETGSVYAIPRMCGTGIFNDPNDFSMILVLAILTTLYGVESNKGPLRFLWLAPLGFFLYALKLTYSRGGLLNLSASLITLSWGKYGWKKTLAMSALCLPAMLALFGGRMTSVDTSNPNDTSVGRVRLWAEGFAYFRGSPLFGVGMDEYAKLVGEVAHNSFVHTYVELGFFGGTLFSGAFYLALWGTRRNVYGKLIEGCPEVGRLGTYIFAMVASYCAGMFSLSRPYVVPTYMILGIA